MKPLVTVALILLFLTGCDRGGSGAAVPEPSGDEIDVTSSAFADGDAIPTKYTCDGEDVSPPLRWGDVRATAYVVVMDDPDAPGDGFVHWGAYGLEDDQRSLAEGQEGDFQAINDFGHKGYGGPCPPPGDEPHHYRFTVYAVDTLLEIQDEAEVAYLLDAISGSISGSGTLTGLYGR